MRKRGTYPTRPSTKLFQGRENRMSGETKNNAIIGSGIDDTQAINRRNVP
jgi:hypothetical protein